MVCPECEMDIAERDAVTGDYYCPHCNYIFSLREKKIRREKDVILPLDIILSFLMLLPFINVFLLALVSMIKVKKEYTRHYALIILSSLIMFVWVLTYFIHYAGVDRNNLEAEIVRMRTEFNNEFILQEEINSKKQEYLDSLQQLNNLKEQEEFLDNQISEAEKELSSDIIDKNLYKLSLLDNATMIGTNVIQLMNDLSESKVALLVNTINFNAKYTNTYRAYGYLLSETNVESKTMPTYKFFKDKEITREYLLDSYEEITDVYESKKISYINPKSSFRVRVYFVEESATVVLTFKEEKK